MTYGTFQAVKVKFPNVLVVQDNPGVGLYFHYQRNSASFTKEKLEVQRQLGFCWRLEGIKFDKYEQIS